jgi:hypothetical protein
MQSTGSATNGEQKDYYSQLQMDQHQQMEHLAGCLRSPTEQLRWNAVAQQTEHQIKCPQAKPNQQAFFSLLDYYFPWYWTTWASALKASVTTTLSAQ